MDDLIDLDSTVEASWRTFEREYAAAVRELRPGQYLMASIDDGYVDDDDEDGGYAMEATPSVMTFAFAASDVAPARQRHPAPGPGLMSVP